MEFLDKVNSWPKALVAVVIIFVGGWVVVTWLKKIL